MPVKLVVFDLDGTLFDTRHDIAAAVNHARTHFQLSPLSLATVTAMVGEGVRVLAERAFSGTEVCLDEATARIMTYYSAHPADLAELYSGVRETLPQIGAIKAVVSNKPKLLVEALLANAGIDGHFANVSGGDSFPRKKPDPMALEFLVSKYGIPPSEMLIVGDHFPDIEMGKRAGVRTVYCNYGFFGNDQTGADFTIEAFPEILEIIERMGRE